MIPPVIIGLCGRAQHGKSTLAKLIVNYYGEQHVAVTAFATPGKKMLEVFGLEHNHLYGNSKGVALGKLGGHTPRHAMQTLLTEWGRNCMYDEIWVDWWHRSLADISKPIIVVEDVRHAPEIDRIQELGGYLVEVYRPDMMPNSRLGWLRHWLRQRSVHPSERLNFSKLKIPCLYNIFEEGYLLTGLFAQYPELKTVLPRSVRFPKFSSGWGKAVWPPLEAVKPPDR